MSLGIREPDEYASAASLRMGRLYNCANTIDGKSNLELVKHFRAFAKNRDWKALGHKTAKACIEKAVTEGYITGFKVAVLLTYWRMAKAADRYQVDSAVLAEMGFNRARMVFSAPPAEVPGLLGIAAKTRPSDLEDRVKGLRGIRNISSVSFTGLLPSDLVDLDHARSINPGMSGADFLRTAIKAFLGLYVTA